ncbi:MAG: outer membrane beta-barrel protein [Haliscomenobacter sp.]|nr:outer membrane beta-barrel protein [Haliscomenobacter sp.]
MQDRDQQDQLANIGWTQMRQLLDKEMPERRRGVFWWWLLPVFLAVAGGAVFAWYASAPGRESPIRPGQQREKEALPAESLPQANQGYEAFPSPKPEKNVDASSSGLRARIISKVPAGVLADVPGSNAEKSRFTRKMEPLSLPLAEPGIPSSGVASRMEPKDPVGAPFSKGVELAAITPRLAQLAVPERKEEWEFTPTAPGLSKTTTAKWSFLGEASALANISSQNPKTGAAAGIQLGRPVSGKLAVLSGLSLERFSSAVQTPFSGTATVVDVSQPIFGTPNKGSTVVALAEEVPVRSWGIYLPLLAQVRLNRYWRLEGGARVGYLMNYSLGTSLAAEQLRESSPVLAAAAESPFAGAKGQALDPDLFRSVDTQWSLEAGRMAGKNWIVYARYRQGLGNGVKVDQYEVRAKIIQIGMKYRFGQ